MKTRRSCCSVATLIFFFLGEKERRKRARESNQNTGITLNQPNKYVCFRNVETKVKHIAIAITTPVN
jgi:hypothetical protein